MKKLLWLVFTLLLVSVLFAQEKKETLAILDFNVVSGISPRESVTLTNIFRSEMFKTGRFDVLERNDMESILKEQAFTLTGACNSAECAIEIGQLLSAEKMVIGDFGKVGETFSITIRMVNVSTGKMEMVLNERFQGDPETFLEIIKKMAQQLSGTYEEETSFWWYVGGAAVVGGIAAIVFLKSDDSPGTTERIIGSPPGDPAIP
jgi:TolB-like protein